MAGHYTLAGAGGLLLGGMLIHIIQMVKGCCARHHNEPSKIPGPGSQIVPAVPQNSPQRDKKLSFKNLNVFVNEGMGFFRIGSIASAIFDFCGIREYGMLACINKKFYEFICGNTEFSYLKGVMDDARCGYHTLQSTLLSAPLFMQEYFTKEECKSIPYIDDVKINGEKYLSLDAESYTNAMLDLLPKFDELRTWCLKGQDSLGRWMFILRIRERYGKTIPSQNIGLLIVSQKYLEYRKGESFWSTQTVHLLCSGIASIEILSELINSLLVGKEFYLRSFQTWVSIKSPDNKE